MQLPWRESQHAEAQLIVDCWKQRVTKTDRYRRLVVGENENPLCLCFSGSLQHQITMHVSCCFSKDATWVWRRNTLNTTRWRFQQYIFSCPSINSHSRKLFFFCLCVLILNIVTVIHLCALLLSESILKLPEWIFLVNGSPPLVRLYLN